MKEDTYKTYSSRKQAIDEQKKIRETRLSNSKVELTEGILELTEFHTYLSLLDMDGKSQELSNAVSFIATALTNLNKYIREENK